MSHEKAFRMLAKNFRTLEGGPRPKLRGRGRTRAWMEERVIECDRRARLSYKTMAQICDALARISADVETLRLVLEGDRGRKIG